MPATSSDPTLKKPIIATKDAVFRVANDMAKEQRNPTVHGIRERLGGGNLKTISKHLKAWRQISAIQKSPIIENHELARLPSLHEAIVGLHQSINRQGEATQKQLEAIARRLDALANPAPKWPIAGLALSFMLGLLLGMALFWGLR